MPLVNGMPFLPKLPGLILPSPATYVLRTVKISSTGSGTWTVPADAVGPFIAALRGPGADGIGSSTTYRGGGSSGALCIKNTGNIFPGQRYSYVVGAVGTDSTFMGMTAGKAAASSGANPGTAGVASGGDVNINGSLGGVSTQVSGAPTGGFVGNPGVSGANATNEGAAGTAASLGDARYTGGGGAGAPSDTTGAFPGAAGGAGGYDVGSIGGTAAAGQDARGPGAGGGGGYGSGGAGGPGILIITYLARA